MKKTFWIYILMSMLILGMLGCGGTSSSIEYSTEVSAVTTESSSSVFAEDPNDVCTLFDSVEGCVTILRIRVNPELELYLDVHGLLLEVKALNDDAKSLLEGIDFSSASYDVGVQMILFALHDHGYSGDGRNLEITMYSNGEALESETILQNIGAAIAQVEGDLKTTFACQITPVSVKTTSQEDPGDDSMEESVEETVTEPELPELEPETLSSYTEEERDPDGNVIRTYYYEPVNGRPMCVRESGQNDGRLYDLWYHYDEAGVLLWHELVHEDGSKNETYYEDGLLSYSKSTDPSGRYLEDFYENGIRVRVEETDKAKGIYATYLCDADGSITYGSGQRGDLRFEATYYKNGVWATWTSYHPTGEKTVEYFSEDGDLQKIDCYDASGNYVETKYP